MDACLAWHITLNLVESETQHGNGMEET